jgi:hypothetical protein
MLFRLSLLFRLVEYLVTNLIHDRFLFCFDFFLIILVNLALIDCSAILLLILPSLALELLAEVLLLLSS